MNTTTEFERFICPAAEMVGEPGVGVTFHSVEQRIGGTWLCWSETVELHAWLSKLLEAANDSP